MAVAIEVAGRAELIDRRVERPASERVPLGAIIGAVKVAPDCLSMPIPHGLVTISCAAVAIVVGHRPERVVAGVEQPAAETRAVRRHHWSGHRRAGLLEDADAPRAADDYFGMAVAIHVADTLRKLPRGWNDDAVTAVERIVDVAVAIGDHEKPGAGAVGMRRPPKPVPHELRQIQARLLSE